MDFIHLHIHTEYSLLDSTVRINELVGKAAGMEMSALAITDKDVMYGVIPFYKKCKESGIKPIIGLELWVNGLESKGSAYPVVLLAKNNEGYQSLLKLSTYKQCNNTITLEEVEKELKHCFIIMPYADSEAASLLRHGDTEKAARVVENWKRAAEKHSLYLERQPVKEEGTILKVWEKIAAQHELPLAAGNNVHMVNEGDRHALCALQAIAKGVSLQEVKDEAEDTFKGVFMDPAITKDVEETSLLATKDIAERCNVHINFEQRFLPRYPLSEGKTPDKTLRAWCEAGAVKRFGHLSETVIKRLEMELAVIHQMGFDDYFLIVADFVKFARERGMLVGPGRGSAAGSLVAYLLEITDIDPLKHRLLFERFLNPERVTMPDIDIDFPDYRRDEVIEYVSKKYGRNRVARIITFGTFGARAAVRDAGRIIQAPQALIERMASLIPQEHHMTLQKAAKTNPSFKQLLDQEPLASSIWSIACKVEGLPRHTSIHAAGVVMSAEELTNHVPVMKKSDEVLMTQYSMDILEDIGLLKMDFLGLKNLSLLERITRSIRFQEGIEIDLRQLPIEDKKTFQLLASGDTTGVFQLESEGMRQALKEIKPSKFEDIAAVNALYRPGPMENIPLYARRKEGVDDPEYYHENLKEILAPTYGVIIYQEQIMQIASVIAGYTYGEADLLRRAISKKVRSVLEKERTRFIEKAGRIGYPTKLAASIYDLIVRFADYGFNRSHAVAYSYIAYQLAYLKAHYPAYFYAALLTMNQDDSLKLSKYLREARHRKITILPPSINNSRAGFFAYKSQIYFGMSALKYVNRYLIESILAERGRSPFLGFIDFLMRVDANKFVKGIESLIKAGAFDELDDNRAVLLASLRQALEFVDFQKDLGSLVSGGDTNFRYVQTEPFTNSERFEAEKEVAGVYLTGHPLERYNTVLLPFQPVTLYESLPVAAPFWVAGMIEKLTPIRTKKGQAMAFLTLTDGEGEAEVVIFPDVYRNIPLLKEQSPVLVGGRKDKKSGRRVLADHVLPLEEVFQQAKQTLFLKIEALYDRKKRVNHVKQILRRYPGSTRVVLYDEKERKTFELSDQFRVFTSNSCLRQLKDVLSEESVVLKNNG
ncbi:DNA polymerase III subunit alpha [Bacillus piscicola]|uniref:DNA polymerase III subunit alpha n=1 Tax=Bacillus piscicola TaxID=1632684 RepID=UPI001F094FB0|nr:DNA polymerase III subunit alpha [Bacillus piscicola]